jgi:hypothetical protein
LHFKSVFVIYDFSCSPASRTLFEVTASTAVSISGYSAFAGEAEFVLRPGTQLRVVLVTKQAGQPTVVALSELPELCQVK